MKLHKENEPNRLVYVHTVNKQVRTEPASFLTGTLKPEKHRQWKGRRMWNDKVGHGLHQVSQIIKVRKRNKQSTTEANRKQNAAVLFCLV